MSVKEALHELVNRLDDERAAEVYAYLSRVADGHGEALAHRPRDAKATAMSGQEFFSAPPKDLETLAREQGIEPVTDFDSLLGDFWPEDETADDFIAAVRQWRREGGDA